MAFIAGELVLLAVPLALGIPQGSPIGAADNGDGSRVYCSLNLTPGPPTGRAAWMGTVTVDFVRAGPCDAQPGAANLVLRAAAGDSGPVTVLDLGWAYAWCVAGVTTLAVWALLGRGRTWPLMLLPVLFPLLNTDFSRFFISTYGEPAGLLGCYTLFSGLVVVGATDARLLAERVLGMALIAAGGLFAATAKLAYLPLLPLCLLLVAMTPAGGRPRARRLVGIGLAAITLAASILPLRDAAAWQQRGASPYVNAYHLTYTFVLAEVPGSASSLGLPPAAAQYAGAGFWPLAADGKVPGTQIVAADPTAARTRALGVLAAHPDAVARGMWRAMLATNGRDLDYLPRQVWSPTARGYVSPSLQAQGTRRDAQTAWLATLPRPWYPPLVSVLCLLAVPLWRRLRPGATRALLGVAISAGASALGLIVTAILGDGFYELAKHVWLSAWLLDVAAGGLLGAALTVLMRRFQSGPSSHPHNTPRTQP